MKVCHLASGDLWAGAEVVLADLLAGIKTFSDVQITAILLNHGVLEEHLRAYGIPVTVIEESAHTHLGALRELSRVLKGENIDILHTHRYKEHIFGAILARRCGIRHLVCTVHGMPEPFAGYKRMKARLYHTLERLVFRARSSAVVAVSHDIAGQLKRKVSRVQVITIHNGIRLARTDLQPHPQDPILADWSSTNAFVIGTASRLTPVKALHLLLEAFEIVSRRFPDCRLAILGDGACRQELEERALRLGIDDKVTFFGFRKEIVHYLSRFSIFVLSSLHEGIPIALLEAMSLGVPVVVTNVGGNPEVVIHEESGLLVRPQDVDALAAAIARLYEDKSLRARLAANGKRRVEECFSQKNMATKTAELYHSLMKHHKPSPINESHSSEKDHQ